jgi:hypothetical protein
MPRPRLSQLNLWQKHCDAVIAILQKALDLMAADDVSGLEPALNRALCLYFLKAMSLRRKEGLFVPGGLPIMEARNQPTPATEGKSSEDMIPDIQWGYQDEQADAMRSARLFHIECKRLGNSTLSGRYVSNGIWRFIDSHWSYGKDVADGAMVGYVKSSGSATALVEVNRASSSKGIPPLAGLSEAGARRDFIHQFERSF